jgi:hypothetical protein
VAKWVGQIKKNLTTLCGLLRESKQPSHEQFEAVLRLIEQGGEAIPDDGAHDFGDDEANEEDDGDDVRESCDFWESCAGEPNIVADDQ